ncbi:hypothetical protein [Flavobacterium suncheonense]|uniref:Uncharacterized protein n=1 Tax=Flavobacterium suncheonense GH29-5 = DSM 17707 TaxID=1121899 RepID=A0A0A2MDI5_9FLAO|nr:hypothetical protein [Flavobacterium suncheonense]KGO90349.1 hypothetical protein Q764_02015 [Flavobacterium suncheonense GH29-5 = DSM 17707]
MTKNNRKIRNLLAFYKSTIAVNLAVSLLCFLFGGFSEFVLMFISFGFVVSLSVKEVRKTNDYLFYYNNGWSKLQLWGYAGLINLTAGLSLLSVYLFFFNQ